MVINVHDFSIFSVLMIYINIVLIVSRRDAKKPKATAEVVIARIQEQVNLKTDKVRITLLFSYI